MNLNGLPRNCENLSYPLWVDYPGHPKFIGMQGEVIPVFSEKAEDKERSLMASNRLRFPAARDLVENPQSFPKGHNRDYFAPLDLNGDGKLTQDEFLAFSDGGQYITSASLIAKLVRLDTMDGRLDGRIARKSLNKAAEEARAQHCKLSIDALPDGKDSASVDKRHVLLLRDKLFKEKTKLYQSGGNHRLFAKTTDLNILSAVLKDMAAYARQAVAHDSEGEVDTRAWNKKFFQYLNDVFLGGNIPLMPKSQYFKIDLSDSGWHDMLRDQTENQTFHTLALMAISYRLGPWVAKAANVFHETLDPFDMRHGKSAEDYRASDLGIHLGKLFRTGELMPEKFVEQLEGFLARPDETVGDLMSRSDRQIGWLRIKPAVPVSEGFRDPRENLSATSRIILENTLSVLSYLNPLSYVKKAFTKAPTELPWEKYYPEEKPA